MVLVEGKVARVNPTVDVLVMLIWLLLLTGAISCSAVFERQFSTVRIRITDEGLKFFSKIGHHIVDYEIWKISFPPITLPIESGPGAGEVNVTELTVRAFKSPNFSFKLAPPNGIKWQSKGGSTKLDGDWQAVYYLIAPIYLSGYVKAKVDDIRIDMQTNLLVRNERPQVEVTECTMDVQRLEVHIGGGVVQWVVNLFRAQLAALIKNTIHQKMCGIVRTAIVDQINAALAALPTHVELFKNLFISYSCRQQPIATTTYIQGEMISDVTYGQDQCTLPTEPMDDRVDSLRRMAHIWISQHIPNCLLRTIYESDMFNFSITPDSSGGRFARFLKTDCALFAICIGKFFPTLRLMYPNRTVDLFIQLANTPYVDVDTKSIRIVAYSTVDLYISPWKQQAQKLARLEMNSTTYVMPGILHRKLVGSISNVTTSMREHDSIIGHFNPQVLELLQKMMTKAIRVIGGTALKVGIPLPLIDNVTISDDAQIVTRDGYIRIDFDLTYE